MYNNALIFYFLVILETLWSVNQRISGGRKFFLTFKTFDTSLNILKHPRWQSTILSLTSNICISLNAYLRKMPKNIYKITRNCRMFKRIFSLPYLWKMSTFSFSYLFIFLIRNKHFIRNWAKEVIMIFCKKFLTIVVLIKPHLKTTLKFMWM